ncbi:MAG: N-acetylmuramoyl-L-alanine amidase, partial [Alphaproteobacteria bacterium]|nr:N-acetylmuramoyl-L-alanine amidase [Alphaproteobacteria bacterium]
MSIRAINLIFGILGAGLFAGGLALSAERTNVAAAAGAFPLATDFRIGGDETQTRFVVDLSSKVNLRAFALADPYRVVIDLPQVAFQLKPRAGDSGRGLVKAFRYGVVMAGGSRIVLDLTKPARI